MKAKAKAKVTVGNAGGYWGDDPEAWERQLRGGSLDYLTADYLAETTLSILHRQRAENPALGYATDFVRQLTPLVGECLARGVRVLVNAGGANPTGCAEALVAALTDALPTGTRRPRIAIVQGDDLLDRVGTLHAGGVSFENLDTGEPFSRIAARLTAANAYLGAWPLVEALRAGADIVITGRVADAALVVAPLVHELGWGPDDWNRLAAGVVVGHLLECGAQVTGGNHSDWRRVAQWDRLGYPIAEVEADGSFVLTKHPGTGGLVSVETVKEQLLYEIGDPGAYVTPDVIADFTTLSLEADGADRVRVRGATGYEPTDHYKVSMAWANGFRSSGGVLVCGPDAIEKAKAYAGLFWARLPAFEETSTEYVGWNAFHGAVAGAAPADEVWLRLGARDADRKTLGAFAKLLPALILSAPPGITYSGSLPKAQEVVSFWPALVPKAALKARVSIWEGRWAALPEQEGAPAGAPMPGRLPVPGMQIATAPSRPLEAAFAERNRPGALPLSALALARSGDKGDTLNLGLLARTPSYYRFLKEALTAQRVKDWFQETCQGTVRRFEADNLLALNFVLERALGGGGTTTLRLDHLGKGMGQALLRQWLPVPDALRREYDERCGQFESVAGGGSKH